jgi:hypothetical protein
MALADNLLGYWNLDESSGDAIDAHGSNDLTETGGTVGAAAGKINGCRDFEADDSAFFTVADNTDLSTGDVDLSLAGWVNAESFPGGPRMIAAKYTVSGDQREYALLYTGSAFAFRATSDGAIGTLTTAVWGSSPSTSTWYFVAGGHSASSNEIWVSVNAGTPVTASHAGGVYDGTADFTLGANASGNYWDGLIDEIGLWKRDIRSDLAALYNSGNGLSYPFGGGGPTPSPYPYAICI